MIPDGNFYFLSCDILFIGSICYRNVIKVTFGILYNTMYNFAFFISFYMVHYKLLLSCIFGAK